MLCGSYSRRCTFKGGAVSGAVLYQERCSFCLATHSGVVLLQVNMVLQNEYKNEYIKNDCTCLITSHTNLISRTSFLTVYQQGGLSSQENDWSGLKKNLLTSLARPEKFL